MKRQSVLDRLLGRDVVGHTIETEIEQAEAEAVKVDDMLVLHETTLKAVRDVLSDSQRRVANAINDTGAAIEQHRAGR